MIKALSRHYLAFALILLLLAFGLRVYALEADAPLDVSPTQEMNVDGPNTVFGARNKIIFGEWEPVESPIKAHRQWPGMNWLGYLFFSLIGVGYWPANFISVVTGLLSLALAAGFARRHFGRPAALITAFFIALNFVYIVFNRDPMAYTTATTGLMLSLFLWGLGLKQPLWFFLSGLMTAFFTLYIKLPAIAMLPAAMTGFLPLVLAPAGSPTPWLRRLKGPLLFLAGIFPVVVIWYLAAYRADTQSVGYAIYARTFSLEYGLEENVRFALVSLLQFGVGFGLAMRMIPLFFLAYGYLFLRLFRLVSRQSAPWSPAEAVAFGLLISVTLMLLATAIRPLRFQIVLIPPMAVIAGLAGQKIWQRSAITLPGRIGRLALVFFQLGLTYLFYQLLATLLLLWRFVRFQAGPVNENVIITIPTSFILLMISFFLSIVFTLIYLRYALRSDSLALPLPVTSRRVALVGIILGFSLASAIFQYGSWAIRPAFSVVTASRQVGRDFSADEAIIGGLYAPALTLENELPASFFNGGMDPQAILAGEFTHIAMEVESPLITEVPSYDRLAENIPCLTSPATLVESYNLRQYIVHIYLRNDYQCPSN